MKKSILKIILIPTCILLVIIIPQIVFKICLHRLQVRLIRNADHTANLFYITGRSIQPQAEISLPPDPLALNIFIANLKGTISLEDGDLGLHYAIDIDRSGFYGYKLYTATRVFDNILRINTNGNIEPIQFTDNGPRIEWKIRWELSVFEK